MAPLLRRLKHAPLRLGDLQLTSNLFLAPLAGYTDVAFRLLCREQGGVGLATTEMISAAALNRNAKATPRYLVTAEGDAPLSVQIDGGQESELVDAARRLEDLGFPVIDINMGCPVRRIVGKGGGSAWTKAPERAAEAIGKVIAAVQIPVTAKTRLGWDADELTAPDLARALEAVGVKALTVHGRTRAQGFSGTASLAGIRAVVEAADRMPVIGNGDIRSVSGAVRMLSETGCAGVAIGRAALGDPWIFRDTEHFLRTGQLPTPPTREARVQVCRRHFDHLHALFSERRAVVRFRKAGVRYSASLGVGKAYRRAMSFVPDAAAVHGILDDVLRGAYGHGPARTANATVSVPKGPVSHW